MLLVDEESYKKGFNDGYKKGFDVGYYEACKKGNIKNPLTQVKFLKVQCECGAVNYHPIHENKLVLNIDEERRCFHCEKIISRDSILEGYSKLQPPT